MKVGDIHIEEIIFEQTKELLLRYGVKGWNMNDLSSKCNMSKRTLYKIIGTKEDLLCKIIQVNITNDIARIRKHLQSSQPFPYVLENLSNQIIERFDDYTLNNLKAIHLEYPRIWAMIELHLKQEQELSFDFFQKGIDEGYLVDYASPKTIFKIMHILVVHHLATCNNKIEFRNEMEEVLNIFFKGIMK